MSIVNEKFDDGKIVAQRVVPVTPADTPDDVAARGASAFRTHQISPQPSVGVNI